MSETVRTRFAPSPTGFLHVGTARTALYSYLSARRAGGQFLLRIEDTDTERNVADSAAGIVDGLHWLGLDWDEGYLKGGPHGPYVQTERLDRYHAAVNALVAHGDAYLCYCTSEELEQRRKAAEAHGLPPGYDGHCRHLRPDQVRAYEAEGRRPAVRFRLPDEGETVVEDLVRGTVVFDNATLTDFVILRANGIPTYHFSATFDDVDMAITHVIRGEDLFPSTPRHVHLFRALPGHPARLRPPAADRRGRPAQAVQAPRQGLGAAVPRGGLPARGHGQLPGPARLVAGRPHRAVQPGRPGAAVLAGAGLAQPGRLRHQEARRPQRPLPAPASPGRVRRPGLALRGGRGVPKGRPGPAGPGRPAGPGAGQPPDRGARHGRVPAGGRGRARPGGRGQGPDRRGPGLPLRGGQAADRGRAVDDRGHRDDPARPPGGAGPQAQDRLPAGPPGHHRPPGQPAPVRVHGAARQAPLPGPPGPRGRPVRLRDRPGGR